MNPTNWLWYNFKQLITDVDTHCIVAYPIEILILVINDLKQKPLKPIFFLHDC